MSQDIDLSHMQKELADPNRKLTALELWNNLAEDVIVFNGFIKMTHKKVVPVTVHYEKMKRAIDAIRHFEITKHRVLVDAVIDRLEALGKEYSNTSIIRFTKRKRLVAQIEAYKTALFLITNTPPPEGAKVQPTKEMTGSGPAKPAKK